MAVKVEVHEIPENNGHYDITHNLGKNLHLSVWQNGFLVTPSVRVLDESTLTVYNLVTGGTAVLIADVPAKTSGRSKTSGTGKSPK